MEEETKKEENKEEGKEESKEEKQVSEKPLDKMTVTELREVAKKIPGVTGVSAMKKDEVLAIIKEYGGIEDEKPAEKKKKDLPTLSVKDLKKKVVHLKEQKEKAREEKDRKRVDILRLRINRLKKQTRKVAQG